MQTIRKIQIGKNISQRIVESLGPEMNNKGNLVLQANTKYTE